MLIYLDYCKIRYTSRDSSSPRYFSLLTFRLKRSSDLPLIDVCYPVGFERIGSFSTPVSVLLCFRVKQELE